MKKWRNLILRSLMQGIFKFVVLIVAVDNFFQRRRKQRSFTGLPASYETVQPALQKVYLDMKAPKFWAQTSGTRRAPKLIPYDKKRIQIVQMTYMKAIMVLTSPYPGLKTLFVLSSLGDDSSLTSGLLKSEKEPGLIALLQAPYRYLQTKNGLQLRELVGDLAARILVMSVSQPRFIYATNPSSFTHLLKEVEARWDEVRKGIRAILGDKNGLTNLLALADGDALVRLKELSHLSQPPKLKVICPQLQALISWDGGYVGVFLEQVKSLAPELGLIPMFSMSTEALETIPHRIKGRLHFLPTAAKTHCEFQDLDSGVILGARDLIVNRSYSLLVSDHWGLIRYDTQDVFRVVEIVDGLPDLRFIKRRGITSSLTGEKLTETHVTLLVTELRKEFSILEYASCSLYPIEKLGSFGYTLAVIGAEVSDDLAKRADEVLCSINTEYESKVLSGRLARLEVASLTVADLASIMGKGHDWESQFKVLPLYEKIIRRD